MHGEMAQAEAEQQPRESRVAGHFATDRDLLAGPLAGLDGVQDQVEHGRMQRVVEMRHGVVGTVDGQRVLNEVVGADGEEIQFAGESVSADSGSRNLDHAANLDILLEWEMLFLQTEFGAFHHLQGLAQFGQTGQHGDEDLDVAVMRCAQ